MGKYEPLQRHLASCSGDREPMTFAQMEQLVGPLPDSARSHRAWWGNDGYKSQSIAWRAAGWHVESVDQIQGRVTFARGLRGGAPNRAPMLPAVGSYIDPRVIAKIHATEEASQFDWSKLLRLIDEVNGSYRHGNAYAVHTLLRAILDHVPPLFGRANFAGVLNNYPWGQTDKAYMRKLLDFRLQADDVLHRQISARQDLLSLEDLPPRAWINRLLQECAPAQGAEDEAPRASEPSDSAGRAMLKRLTAFGQASCLALVYDGLADLGYLPKVPVVRVPGKQPQPYLSWFDPTRGGPTVIRFTAEKLWFIRREDLSLVADLPGSRTETDGGRYNVNWPMRDEHVEAILEGASRIKQ
jgi:hypothetical protein